MLCALLTPPVNISHLALRENDNRQWVMRQLKISLELEGVVRGTEKRGRGLIYIFTSETGANKNLMEGAG